jgi:hypothetical protein
MVVVAEHDVLLQEIRRDVEGVVAAHARPPGKISQSPSRAAQAPSHTPQIWPLIRYRSLLAISIRYLP